MSSSHDGLEPKTLCQNTFFPSDAFCQVFAHSQLVNITFLGLFPYHSVSESMFFQNQVLESSCDLIWE